MQAVIRRSPLVAVIIAFVAVTFAVFNGSAVHAASTINVPVTASSQVAVTNITLAITGTTARVQFDYALVNGATTGFVDAALNDQQSFGPVTVAGSGHYDASFTDPTINASSKIYVISSGNPDFLIQPANNCDSLFGNLLQLVKNLISHLFRFF